MEKKISNFLDQGWLSNAPSETIGPTQSLVVLWLENISKLSNENNALFCHVLTLCISILGAFI
jgi:hypothetical protein